jgi:hypothetical protein
LPDYQTSVFVNCPFDKDFAPILEAMLFCIVRSGLTPRLAAERLEAGESRLDKIIELIGLCRYSVHDLSRAVAAKKGDLFRMNMPFELGLDMGRRRAPDPETNDKKFIIFESNPYEIKKCLSDLGGVDVEFHRNNYQMVIKKLRDFLRVEAGCELPGPSAIEGEYVTFQGWMIEKKISEGHTEEEAVELPTQERLDEMISWMEAGRPNCFNTV